MAKKKVKIKVKKKKLNFIRVFVALAVILFFAFSLTYIVNLPIKNIYIIGNEIVPDKEIIELAELTDYPPYLETYLNDIKGKILKNQYIKDVKIKRKLINKIYIEIEEYKPIAIYNKKVILSSNKQVENIYNIDYLPYVTNNIDQIYDSFVTSFGKINKDTLLKISQIEYSPNDVDKERFILYMVDANYVHITLTRIQKVNKYNSIVSELENKKGIIYLDSGDYVEIKG